MPNLQFSTQVSGEKDGIHYIRSKPLSELVGTMSFASAVYFMITGQIPTHAQEQVFNALLVASLDHGISPASGFVPRVVASTGNDLIHSLASGLLALGPYHGGAITGAAEILQQVKEHGLESLQQSHFSARKRLLGLGHPHYKLNDPRTDQLFQLARDAGISHEYQDLMLDIQKYVYTQLDKHLVINIDGCIAALLLDLGFPTNAGNGLFALARAGGMIAHILEEYQEKPVRRIDEEDITFHLPEEA
jgi:citrate synthase